MDNLVITKPPIAHAGMLIRRPAAEVFEAIVDPHITTRFWFTKSSGRLKPGKQVKWHWEMFGVTVQVDVKEMDPPRRILMEWGEPGDMTQVEWNFKDRGDGTTYVEITDRNFTGNGDEIVAKALDSATGFTIVLIGLKALLEHNINLDLIRDKYPDGLAQ